MENRREVFALMGAALMAASASPAAAKVKDAVLPTEESELMHHPFGDLRVYYRGETEQLKAFESGSLRLNAGASPHPPHQHPEEEILIVAEGSGEIVLDGKVTQCSAGSIMFCKANVLHGIENTGKSPLLFYYVKWKCA